MVQQPSPPSSAAPSSLDAPWSLSADAAARALAVDPVVGLTTAEAARRRETHGPNRLDEAPAAPWWRRLVGQFADFMTGLLALAAVVSALAGEWVDSLLIAAIVLANGVVSWLQEQRAEEALSKLRAMAQPLCTVRRDGRRASLPAAELVPGDVIEVSAGARAPADARLIDAHELTVDESPLTGESLPVEKALEPVPAGAAAADRADMLHAGSTVQTGRGRAVVVATGMGTELGRIASLLQSTERTPTPLELQLAALSKRLAVLVAGVCVLVFAASVWRTPSGRLAGALPELFMTAVSLAVAAVPEGLPAVITVALALGSQRMASRHAILRQLAAVETLGSVGVVCSDKTGTLTRNQMEVVEHQSADDSPEGAASLWRAAALASNAEFHPDAPPQGNPTDLALLRAALDSGLDAAAERKAAPRIGEFVFSSHRKRVGSLHAGPEGTTRLYCSGAVEQILKRCRFVAAPGGPIPLDDARRAKIEAELESQAARARRVIGVAQRDLSGRPPSDAEAAEVEMVFLGWAAILDPVRPEAREAIAKCRSAGVRTVMITGDHPITARAIASDLGLLDAAGPPIGPDDPRILSGEQLDQLDDAALSAKADTVAVYARVTPAHKLRIVKALQASGEVVAMTGDGVNDAPALKQADIGVAMGITGTDVSKEAAKMVLADDNFASIVAAVEEGRAVYDSIRKFVRYLLTSNLAEVLCLFLAILAGWPAPLLPVHLLWINLVTDGLPALALAFEKPEDDLMRRPPRPAGEGLFTWRIVVDIAGVGLLMALACLAVYGAWLPAGLDSLDDRARDAALDLPRTMMFLTLSLFQLFFILGVHSRRTSFFADPFANPILIAAVGVGAVLQVGVAYSPLLWPGFAATFHVAVPTPWQLAVSVATASSALFLVEAWKLLSRRRDEV